MRRRRGRRAVKNAGQRQHEAGWSQIGGGLLLAGVGAAVLLWPSPRVTADVGSVLAAPAVGAAAAGAAAAVDVLAAAATAGGPVVGVPAPGRRPVPDPPAAAAPAAPPPAPAGFVPQRLAIASVGIDAPLLATSVDGDGALVPPEDPAELGWWRGVRPGTGAGSVVVAGHVDAKRYGQGPLASLVQLSAGDRAVVTGTDGASTAYVLRGVQTFPKDALPAAELFGHDGPERLVLVTCGGTFDPKRGGWDSNIVAVLDPERRPGERLVTDPP